MTAPERSLKQRMTALENANRIRTKRAELKRDIKASRVRVATVLLKPPPYAETMAVVDLLLAVPKVGRVKAYKTLQLCRVSPSKTLKGMTQRQRSEIITMLERR
jgi:hypothetical protein